MNHPKLAFFVSILTIFSIFMPVDVRADEPPTSEQMRRFFEAVALGKRSRAKIVKWVQTPTIRLETLGVGPRNADTGRAVPIPVRTDAQHYNFLSDHIANLNALSGLNMRLMPIDVGSGGDIVISVAPLVVMSAVRIKGAPEPLLKDLLGPGRCFFIAWPDKNSRLYRAHIMINSTLDEDHIRHCFLEELTQSLGLPHDSDMLRPSIFNESTMQPALSPIDRIMIRTLYDPRITLGMGLGGVRPIVEDIIKQNSIIK